MRLNLNFRISKLYCILLIKFFIKNEFFLIPTIIIFFSIDKLKYLNNVSFEFRFLRFGIALKFEWVNKNYKCCSV